MNPSSSTMNANSSKSLVAILLLAAGLVCLVACLAQAAPAHDAEESNEYAAGNPSSDESSSAINGDSEFDDGPNGRANAQQDDEDLAPNSNPMSMADSADEPRGSDSNIANAKVQVNPADMATAAGHHYSHGHSVSGKMEMGAHTEKKGAFGWHAKFPVGGKGKK